jgi:uncharacterized protein
MLAMEILRRVAAPVTVILFFFAALFIYTKLAGPIPFDVNSVNTSKSDAFSVSGEGRVKASPDSATVRLGVVATAATSEQAKTALNTNINKVIEAVKALGIEEKSIKTENFNVYPEYDAVRPLPADQSVSNQDKISGYTANTNIAVTVDNAEIANKIVDAGVSAGANQVGGVDFQVKDKTASLNKAREMAVADAKKKAEDAARIAGFKLGKVINYSEGSDGNYPRFLPAAGGGDAKMQSAPTEVQPGTNEIMVTVTLSYEIR